MMLKSNYCNTESCKLYKYNFRKYFAGFNISIASAENL